MEKAMQMIRSHMAGRTGRDFWKALDDLASRPEMGSLLPEQGLSKPFPFDLTRRSFLKAFAASVAVSTTAGCSANPDENAFPYVHAPNSAEPYESTYYASAVSLAGFALPVLGKTVAGRPVKLEGNPDQPLSEGATDPFLQAALYGLYDPSRSQSPRLQGHETTWSNFEQLCIGQADELDRTAGEGFRLLTGHSTSPTLLRQISGLRKKWPGLRWHTLEPSRGGKAHEATTRVFGRPLDHHLRLDRAAAIISFGDDFLGAGPRQAVNARRWSKGRQRFRAGEGRCPLYVAEPSPTLTGSRADKRLAASPARIGILLAVLAQSIGIETLTGTPDLSDKEREWLASAENLLQQNPGRTLITIGADYPAEMQALVLLANHRTGAGGTLLHYTEPIGQPSRDDRPAGIQALVDDMKSGQVSQLMIVGCNPAYATAGALGFSEALKKVTLTIHAGLHFDETATLCNWHLPLEHDLETWTDLRATDGTVTIVQPLVKPFYDVRSAHRILAMVEGSQKDGRTIVEDTWRSEWGDQFDDRWRRSLIAGYVESSAAAIEQVATDWRPDAKPARTDSGERLHLVITPDPTIWDGSLSDNGWLQELPKPLTKVTWGNVVTLSPALARRLEVETGDEVAVETPHGRIAGPAWVMPGQADDAVTVTLGYGRKGQERLADGLGYNAYSLLAANADMLLQDIKVAALGRRVALATTQPHQDMGDHDFVRTYRPGGPPIEQEEAEDQPSFYPERKWDSPSWGMSIDLDACIGCNSCVVACMAENNVPVVGKDLVAQGREMHWLRVDHYFDEGEENPKSHFQPVPCMHCEEAPCEMGCPVNATVHSFDGLNLQIYNRCIGTRTCSSFCPYKVRRFNWFDYTGDDPEEIRAMRNPDVTVRDRGIMEKCTYCIQRISDARINAEKEGRAIRDGEVVTACQQACPSQAIRFGDVTDPQSAVSREKAEPRNYTLLKEVNTRPRTTYLARVEGTVGEAEEG